MDRRASAALLLFASACSQTVTLRIERTGEGFAHVTSSPPGLDCAPPCEADFPADTTVVLTAAPTFRSSLVEWEGESCGASTSCTVTLTADRTVSLRLDRDPGVRLSEDNREPSVLLRDDLLAVDFFQSGAVRSNQSIAPGSGVYYYEVHRLIVDRGTFGFGVATADAPLSGASIGATDQSFGSSADGAVYHAGTWLDRIEIGDRVGIVVDYRASTPTVYMIGPEGLLFIQALPALSAPLYIYLAGEKREADWHLEINPGNDTENAPFALDPTTALNDAGLTDVASALVLGWGATAAGPPDEAPTLRMPADIEVEAGTPVTLSATASDAEDGDLSDAIEWELLSSPHYAGRERGFGETFTFTPTAVGIHPALARVRDSVEQRAEAIVRVQVRGPAAQLERSMLVADARSGEGVEISPDGLAVRFTGDGKHGVRANQSLYAGFWYFEIRRLVEPVNAGGGLVIAAGNLDPYTFADVAPSCSINISDGVYRNLVWHSNFPLEPASYEYYGFAVDYRGEHPIVYIIAGGDVIDELVLDDAWVEIHPMLYGNPTGMTAPGGYDEAINFGGSSFAYDAATILQVHGVDTQDFQLGWGSAR